MENNPYRYNQGPLREEQREPVPVYQEDLLRSGNRTDYLQWPIYTSEIFFDHVDTVGWQYLARLSVPGEEEGTSSTTLHLLRASPFNFDTPTWRLPFALSMYSGPGSDCTPALRDIGYSVAKPYAPKGERSERSILLVRPSSAMVIPDMDFITLCTMNEERRSRRAAGNTRENLNELKERIEINERAVPVDLGETTDFGMGKALSDEFRYNPLYTSFSIKVDNTAANGGVTVTSYGKDPLVVRRNFVPKQPPQPTRWR